LQRTAPPRRATPIRYRLAPQAAHPDRRHLQRGVDGSNGMG